MVDAWETVRSSTRHTLPIASGGRSSTHVDSCQRSRTLDRRDLPEIPPGDRLGSPVHPVPPGTRVVELRRELLEETGYAAEEIIHIGTVDPNPAFLDNQCRTYLALGAHWRQPPEFDGSEDIAVEEFPLADIPGLIANGRITHALVVAAFYHYENYLKTSEK